MKQLLNILFICLVASINLSCEDEYVIDEPKFKIKNYKVEDVDTGDGIVKKVTFNFDEEADIISFYSGEEGAEFKYREGKVASIESVDFSFASRCGYGEQDPLSQFSVVASPDFNGNYNEENIHAATWIDITDRFDFSMLTVDNTNYDSSGQVDLQDLMDTYGSFYLAFRYITPNQFENGIYAAIRLQGWRMYSETDLFGLAEVDLDWGLVEIGNYRSGRNVISSSTITLRGNHGSFTTINEEEIAWLTDETEAWVISQKFEKKMDLGADSSLPIKGVGDAKLTSFVHEYSDSGEYEVTFLAANANIENYKKIYKTITVVIP
ncbi:DUF5017 domain-containing protein [Aestuariibaculum sediminum]|uniref:DUF5017 domain-containing protein n=1 Tax=Aestuariibaculum sediminum TaxID=2770637 RepID=A0A8J6Q3H7_9FLAO|nr:DUF5017 domain-containing protein [Aestuariibaculum sediminum]MBD0833666.1 DUF5017 domain-containing protein [Aestuariibaculum sediminum]